MPDPHRTAIRRRLGLAAVAVVAVLALVLGVRDWLDNDGPETVNAPVPAPLDVETRPLPLPAPPLGLAALVAAAEQPTPALIGRRFLIRIPFGCEGAEPGPLTVAFDEPTLRLSATPRAWTAEALSLSEGEADAIEGFWAPAGEDCAAPASDETLGLAMVFEPGGSRLQRRGGRPYEFVGKIAEGKAPSPKGYRLLLAGEVSDVFGDEPVRCHKRAGGEPVCLIAVVFDQVAFEDPVSGETLAEWRMN